MIKTLTEWSAAVKARDMKCVSCGETKNLVAHHIVPKATDPSKKLDINNGETLCTECHIKHHKANPVKERRKDRIALKEKIKMQERCLKEQETQLKEQEAHIKDLSERLSVFVREHNDGRSPAAKELRITILNARIKNLSESNHELRGISNKYKDENRKLKLAMLEYEKAYAELVKAVSV